MFAVLGQYEQRFKNIERVIARNAEILELNSQILERLDLDSVTGEKYVREIRRLLTNFKLSEKNKLNKTFDEEKI